MAVSDWCHLPGDVCKNNLFGLVGLSGFYGLVGVVRLIGLVGLLPINPIRPRSHITFGVNDNIFMLDTSKYPGAIIVRK